MRNFSVSDNELFPTALAEKILSMYSVDGWRLFISTESLASDLRSATSTVFQSCALLDLYFI